MTRRDRALRTLAIAFVAPVLFIAFFSHLATLGLMGPDEPRYAWIARAMAQTHDWVTPRLYGQPWFEKPVFYYWLAGIGFRFLKSGEIAARLPSALAALVAALAIGWIARRLYGEKTAWIVLMIFPTTVAAIGFSRAATPDMLFAASLACTMACAAAILRAVGALDGSETPAEQTAALPNEKIAFIVFGAALGAATLAKGPAAIVLSGGSLLLWAICARNVKAILRFLDPLALASFAVVAVPWYALCAARNPDFLRTFLWLHNVERYMTPVFQHRQPFWFFGPVVLIALLPWTILLVPVGFDGWRLWQGKSWHNAAGFFFFCWAAFPVVFFSFSQSKLPGYILPAIPPLALLMAVSFDRWVTQKPWPARYILVVAGLSLWGVLYLFARVFSAFVPLFFKADMVILEFLIFFLVSTGPFAARPRAVVGMLAACVVFILVIGGVAISVQNPPLSARPLLPTRAWFAKYVNEPIAVYHLNRNWEYGLNFYFGRELPEWSPSIRGTALVFTSEDGLEELSRQALVAPMLEYGYPPCVKAQVTVARH